MWSALSGALTLGVVTLPLVALLGLINLHAFLSGALADVYLFVTLGLCVGFAFAVGRRHDVHRVEFLPAGRPTELRVVRMVGRSSMPIGDLREATAVEHIETPYDECDPDPECSLGVEVRLHTALGLVSSPRHLRTSLRAAGDELDAMLPDGITTARRTEYSPRRRPTIEQERKSWWRLEQVAGAWNLSTADARALALRLQVRCSVKSSGSTYDPGVTLYEPYAVKMVAGQLADGTVARYAVSVLLEQLARVGAPGEPIVPARRAHRTRELFFERFLVALLGEAELTARCEVLRRLLQAWGHTHRGESDPGALPTEVAAYLSYVQYSLCCAAHRQDLPAHVPPPTSLDCPAGPWSGPAGMPAADELAAHVQRALADRPVVRLRRQQSPELA